ncbi:NADH:flavin oxidoreductase/NADH oxidase [Streptomyces sp. NPDC001083]|uniref:NADH:flavin oxidoreductase/NADH oxidase n=1 Tax=Streptomyces sp. NPDC001083 TaxID=3364545 RepID=UPI00367F2ED5
MSALFEPITLRSVTVPNRAWMSPMCMYCAGSHGAAAGAPTDFHLTHLASRAAGGAGLVMTEATAVLPEGRISPHDLGLWNDLQGAAFAPIAATIKSFGAVPAIQLGHAGRKASVHQPWISSAYVPEPQGGWTTAAPSPTAFGELPVPHEMTQTEIEIVLEAFRASTRRALFAGFEALEIHGAHGYLIHSFLSPYSNHRTDQYGGSLRNRMRFALDVVDAVREIWPDDHPLLFRTSATDWLSENPADAREGWTAEDTVHLAKELQAHGVDLLDCSSGALVPDAVIPYAPGFQVPFAAAVRNQTGLPTGAVGAITTAGQAEGIIRSGQADVVLLGRELLRNPYWAQSAAEELKAPPRWPTPYAYVV